MRPFQVSFESLGQYHDFWATVISEAPDQFKRSWDPEPIDQRQALADSFETLRTGLRFVREKVKDDRTLRILEELIQMSFEAYSNGDRKRGIRALQECEGLIWPSCAVRLELAAEAERRAFGTVETFADVKPRKFDGECVLEDLSPHQQQLFAAAHSKAAAIVRAGEERKTFFLVLQQSGELRELKQPSEKKAKAEIEKLVKSQEILAFARTEIVFLGVLVHDIEERGRAHISARALIKGGTIQSYRFFLDDPAVFPVEEADA
jgi:hypothetical protein